MRADFGKGGKVVVSKEDCQGRKMVVLRGGLGAKDRERCVADLVRMVNYWNGHHAAEQRGREKA